jgi:hypothetical protein
MTHARFLAALLSNNLGRPAGYLERFRRRW